MKDSQDNVYTPIGRQLLSESTRITKNAWRSRLNSLMPPEFFLRRWKVAKTKPSYHCKTLEGFKNWHFAQVVRRLVETGQINRELMPGETRFTKNSNWWVWLTPKGQKFKLATQKQAKAEPQGSFLRLVLTAKMKGPVLEETEEVSSKQ